MLGFALMGTRNVVVGSPNAALRPAPGRAPPRWSFEFVTYSFYVTFEWSVEEHRLELFCYLRYLVTPVSLHIDETGAGHLYCTGLSAAHQLQQLNVLPRLKLLYVTVGNLNGSLERCAIPR